MGGGNSTKTVNETDIKNYLNMAIANSTETLTKITNTTITETTNNIVSNAAAAIKNTLTANNDMDIGNINLGGKNNDITLEQKITEQANIKAIIQITNDDAKSTDLTNKINNNITSKISQDAAAQDSLKVLAAAKIANEKEGGLAGIAQTLASMPTGLLNSMTGGGKTDNETITKICNETKIDISNQSKVSNDIATTLINKITTNITHNTNASCNTDLKAENKLKIQNLNVTGENIKFKSTQSNAIDTTIDCIITNANTSKEIQKLGTDAGFTGDYATAQSAQAKTSKENEAATDISNKVKESNFGLENLAGKGMFASILGPLLAMFGPILGVLCVPCAACCCCIFYILIIFLIMKMAGGGGGGESGESGESE
jgi:hypothetical protein